MYVAQPYHIDVSPHENRFPRTRNLHGKKKLWKDEITEHPLIRPFPGSTLHQRSSTYQNFDEYDFQVRNPQTGRSETRNIKGEYRRLVYHLYKEDGSRNTDVSRIEYFENFKAAALEKGGEIKWEDGRGLVFTIPREDGGITWCRVEVSVGAGATYLTIIDEKLLETTLEFGPAQMKAALDAEGKVALYGILFDPLQMNDTWFYLPESLDHRLVTIPICEFSDNAEGAEIAERLIYSLRSLRYFYTPHPSPRNTHSFPELSQPV